MNLVNSSREGLLVYLDRQLQNFFPDGRPARPMIEPHIDEALVRLNKLINAVRMWQPDRFDPLHSSQYAIFLYFLANSIWRREGTQEVCTKLFLLNKALNGIDCFYEIELPEIFFIGHSVGIVLAKASYGNYLVLYQNSTVGKNHGVAPVIEDRVVLYPNTSVIGRCLVRSASIISQGTSVINRDTPGNCLVFGGAEGRLSFKPATRDIPADFFH